MAAQSYGFRALWKRKRPTPYWTVFCSRSNAARRIFYRPMDWTQEATMVNVTIFFFDVRELSSVWLLFRNSLTQRSRFEVLLTADSQWFTRDDSRTFVPTVPRQRRAFTSWNIEVVVHSNSASSVVIFLHQATPSIVSSPRQSAPPFPSLSLSTRRNNFSPRSPLSRKPSNVQLVPACVASGNIHSAVSRHVDKNRGKHRGTVFSMHKTWVKHWSTN